MNIINIRMVKYVSEKGGVWGSNCMITPYKLHYMTAWLDVETPVNIFCLQQGMISSLASGENTGKTGEVG